ncbi:hypothetical protein [Actinocorallia sp. A-T 12471]|uniref:hypothetical protein n=1 Tax=Actinocorallia sp. A-T 12471 TaxID=3089813 RepID=UPI0029CAF6AD|nr:hypothetical protein [Actinocorallia sp. A-T 12471]MDX6742630.1 hypothetical protein [Actinocorallia sp. A-T 12471]
MGRTGLLAAVAASSGVVVVLGLAAYTGREPATVVRPSAPVVRQAVPAVNAFERLGQESVEAELAAAGVRRRSSGECTDRARRDCTSYEGLRRGTLEGLLRFVRESGCEITVSGGTERGHEETMFGHENGYKVDIMPTDCVDSHITTTMAEVARRKDASPMYRGVREGELYVDERRTHWDVFYGPAWCVDKMVRLRRGQCE